MINKITKTKFLGINLIGLLISSALGVFILAVVIRISFTVSNNYKIIKAHSELALAARMLNNFFSKSFYAHGYAALQPITFNIITTPTSGVETRFCLSYSYGIAEALRCSGQQVLETDNSGNMPTFLRISLHNLDSSGTAAYTRCNDGASGVYTSALENSLSPIINALQFANFSVVSIVGFNVGDDAGKIANVTIDPSNVTSTLTTYDSAQGIKLAILLRSQNQVFNVGRTVTFNVFNGATMTYSNDKYLYKLVIVQVPFVYTSDATNTVLLKAVNSTTGIATCYTS